MHIQSATLECPATPTTLVEWTIYPTGTGAFACGSPDGRELRDGQLLKVYLAGHWVAGAIEQHAYQPARFVALTDQSVCGLCPGMRVILLQHRKRGNA